MQIQFTLKSTKGYKPISTLVEVTDLVDYLKNKEAYKKKAIVRMCAQRHWGLDALDKYGYTELLKRVYDKERIARENAERYEKIKRERGWVKEN